MDRETRFTPAQEATEIVSGHQTPEGCKQSSAPAKVLIVDRHPIALRTLTYFIASQGPEVTAVRTAEEALVQFDTTTFDMVFIDGICEKIVSLAESLGTPQVIIISANDLSGQEGIRSISKYDSKFPEKIIALLKKK